MILRDTLDEKYVHAMVDDSLTTWLHLYVVVIMYSMMHMVKVLMMPICCLSYTKW